MLSISHDNKWNCKEHKDTNAIETPNRSIVFIADFGRILICILVCICRNTGLGQILSPNSIHSFIYAHDFPHSINFISMSAILLGEWGGDSLVILEVTTQTRLAKTQGSTSLCYQMLGLMTCKTTIHFCFCKSN